MSLPLIRKKAEFLVISTFLVMLSPCREFFPCEFTVSLAILISSERSQQSEVLFSLEKARLQSKTTQLEFLAIYDLGGRDIWRCHSDTLQLPAKICKSLVQALTQQWCL